MNIAQLSQGLATITWLAFFGFLVTVFVTASRGRGFKNSKVFLLVTLVLAVIMTTISSGLVFIQPEERGVVISAVANEGYREKPLEPGLRWIIPFAETVVTYPISKQNYTMSIAPAEGQMVGDDSIEARTSDGQKVLVDASVIYHINPEQVVKIHIDWQTRYSSELVRAVSRGVIRDAVSQYGVEQVYSTKRLELVSSIRNEIIDKFAENGLVMDDFVLRNISFSAEYAASVEQKQIAEQQAQQARFVVEQKKQEAEQARQVAQGKADAAVIDAKGSAEARIIEAKAEAEALAMITKAIKDNPNLLTYQYISKLSPEIEVMLLPSNAPFVFPLPETNSKGSTTTPVLPEVLP